MRSNESVILEYALDDWHGPGHLRVGHEALRWGLKQKREREAGRQAPAFLENSVAVAAACVASWYACVMVPSDTALTGAAASHKSWHDVRRKD